MHKQLKPMQVIFLHGEDMSGNNIVVCVEKFNKLSGQAIKLFETFYFKNKEDIKLYLLFDSCDSCRLKGYYVLKRFGKRLYSGLTFKEAMKARI